MQKIIRSVMQSLFIAIMMVMGLSCSACALNATVPASLPISVSSNGTVSTATNMKISNYDSNPVKISSMNVTAQNGWKIGSQYSAMKAAINDKIFAIAFNNNWASTSGSVNVSSLDTISANDSLSLSLKAAIPPSTVTETNTAGQVIIVLKPITVTMHTITITADGSTYGRHGGVYVEINGTKYYESATVSAPSNQLIKCYVSAEHQNITYDGVPHNTDSYSFYPTGPVTIEMSYHDGLRTSGSIAITGSTSSTLSLNIDPNSGAVTSYDVFTAPIPRFRAFLDWSDTANVA